MVCVWFEMVVRVEVRVLWFYWVECACVAPPHQRLLAIEQGLQLQPGFHPPGQHMPATGMQAAQLHSTLG